MFAFSNTQLFLQHLPRSISPPGDCFSLCCSTKLKQGIQSEDGCEKGDEKGDEKGCEKGGRTPGKRWSVGRCVREFSESTSMHGVARVGDSRSPVLLRLFWFLLVLTAAGTSLTVTALRLLSCCTAITTAANTTKLLYCYYYCYCC